ncbi:MAG: hypothetical protein CM15mP86_03980 [Gammaproteobacteria bacterium]|nr:MAG: hypothetical protein CM15mP86_03980 [Gammaproteobacteria bacterium]
MAAMTVPAISSSSSLSISIGEYLGFSDTRQIFGLSSNLLQVYEPSIAAMTILLWLGSILRSLLI